MPDYTTILDQVTPRALSVFEDNARRAIARAVVGWPVDTGASRRGFTIRRTKTTVVISNSQRYVPYIRMSPQPWYNAVGTIIDEMTTDQAIDRLVDVLAGALDG